MTDSVADERNKKIALWLATGVLALVFLASGGVKLLPRSPAAESFEAWGYPVWFRYLIGASEVAGALGLLVPRLAPFAASGLVLVMGGAAVTHLRAGETSQAPVPLALIVLLVGVAWFRFEHSKASKVEPVKS